ncbi:hypothetical protein G3570_03650 [Balneolaceae bacterium YR4-1]|uniref:Uncharacterized protein n=1 Tax=Halalkalibaculum roseum TaxID=2709311 RepID=A0A6M1SK87_9BACT|nr:hypothetical protein [Halalkalibaculum roseum]NGP75711.1 hypothetical protein [Halalkalibaculum roseum]
MKLLYGILWLALIGILISCNDAVVTEESTIGDNPEKFSFVFAAVPYGSPYGPKVVDDIYAGSIDRFKPKLKEYPPPPTSFGCTVSWENPEKNSRYLYYTIYVYLPNSLIDVAGNAYQLIKVKALSPDAPDGEVMGQARCILPAKSKIESLVVTHLKQYAEKSQTQAEIDYDVSSHIIDSALYINSDSR